jgi:hypothetical protein
MIRALLGLSAILLIAETVFLGFQGYSARAGYAPEQPIPFSHKLHAGEMGLDCQYCHTQPEKGRQATVPSLNICMNCHSQVKKRVGADEDSPHLAKLREHFEKGEPVAWTRVYDLPDYVYGEACRGGGEGGGHLCVVTDYALSAHLNTAAPQSCTTCHR